MFAFICIEYCKYHLGKLTWVSQKLSFTVSTLLSWKLPLDRSDLSRFHGKGCGGCRKFLLLFGRIGPLPLRPCALLRAWVFFATFNKYPPNSIVIWWYDVIWCVLRSPLRPLARPCIFDASISGSQNPISPEDVIERTGFFINPHVISLGQSPEMHPQC